MDETFLDYPGAELVLPGIADLAAGRLTDEALLVAIGSPRLLLAGIKLPGIPHDRPEARLFERLQDRLGDDAHSQYNALLRRLISFERAVEAYRARSAAHSPS